MSKPSPVSIRVWVATSIDAAIPAVALDVEPGTSAWEAVRRSGLIERLPEIARTPLRLGIHSQPATPDSVLVDGDRVEVYGPLQVDPKVARSRRAAHRRLRRAS